MKISVLLGVVYSLVNLFVIRQDTTNEVPAGENRLVLKVSLVESKDQSIYCKNNY
jgi:hypothetical protein